MNINIRKKFWRFEKDLNEYEKINLSNPFLQELYEIDLNKIRENCIKVRERKDSGKIQFFYDRLEKLKKRYEILEDIATLHTLLKPFLSDDSDFAKFLGITYIDDLRKLEVMREVLKDATKEIVRQYNRNGYVPRIRLIDSNKSIRYELIEEPRGKIGREEVERLIAPIQVYISNHKL